MIVRTAVANLEEGELPIAEIRELPGGEAIDAMLDTRLFKASDADRFSYWHRRVGEYLGAQWLARLADTARKRRRLLSLFHGHGLVPASLRGMHAWLARAPALALDVINADPMGVIEYGDADNLSPSQGRVLLQALRKLASENPHFRDWGPYSLRGIAQPELLSDIRHLIAAPETPSGLRVLVLEAIKGSPIALGVSDELRKLVLDPTAIFAGRSAAGEALAELHGQEDWPAIMRRLLEYGDELSVRLAIELMDDVGYDLFNDVLIVRLALKYASKDESTLGVLRGIEKRLPDSRLDGVLDWWAFAAKAIGKPEHRRGDYAISDFAYSLIARRVGLGEVDPIRLWDWLEPFASSVGYQQDSRQQLDDLLVRDSVLRRAVQKHVLLDLPGEQNSGQRVWRLTKRASGLALNDDDVVQLLRALDPANDRDERWRDIVQFARHDGEKGAEVRAAARPFIEHRLDMLAWLENLATPRIAEWQVRQADQERRRREMRAMEWRAHRESYELHIDALRNGAYGLIVNPAMAYLNLFHGIGESAAPHERVVEWLGDNLADAAFQGFEAFLTQAEAKPTADDIAASFAEGKHWDAAYIVVAALAERLRLEKGFDGLSDERLMAGFFELRHGMLDEYAKIEGLKEALEATLRARGIWEEAVRRYHEPQLKSQSEHVHGLHALLTDDVEPELGIKLAIEWLERFANLPCSSEIELVDRVLHSDRLSELRRIGAGRTNLATVERQRLWDSVGLIVDFDATSTRLARAGVEPELLWNLRHRIGGRYRGESEINVSVAQLAWFINTFRRVWPRKHRPKGVTTGSDNDWDASDYIDRLIHRLGNDTSSEGIAALRRLRDAISDGYTEVLKAVAAEQARKMVESTYKPPSLDVVAAITADQAPANAADLQALMREELAVVQSKVRSDDAESWRGFHGEDGPLGEEACRDHLLGLLRQGYQGVTLDPETHVAGDREVDIACSVGMVRMPIEIKGQWHPHLWDAADHQLDSFYSQDWRAEGRGIYVVLWFGAKVPRNKRLKNPGENRPIPADADTLREMLDADSKATKKGLIEIFVLDLSRS